MRRGSSAGRAYEKMRARKAGSSANSTRALRDATTAADRLTDRLQAVLDKAPEEIASDGDAADAAEMLTILDEVVGVAVKQIDEIRDLLDKVDEIEFNQADI